MAYGRVFKSAGLKFAALGIQLLDLCTLSPPARAVLLALDACETANDVPSLDLLATRSGFLPGNRKSVVRYLVELETAGFVRIRSGKDSWNSNSYELLAPDYTRLSNPLLLQEAYKAAMAPRKGTWGRGRGKSARKARQAKFDRLAAWQTRLASERRKYEKTVSLGRELVGTPVPTSLGTPVPTPHELINLQQGEGGKAGAALISGSPPTPFLNFPKNLPLGSAPNGWQGYAKKFYTATKGRRFVWTETQQRLATEINFLLEHTDLLHLLADIQDNFLAEPYWSADGPRAKNKKATNWPLEALKKRLHDFVPVDLSVCDHEGAQREQPASQAGIEGKETFCGRCKRILKFTPAEYRELTAEEREQLEASSHGREWLRRLTAARPPAGGHQPHA